MKRTIMTLALVALAAGTAEAQNPPPPRQRRNPPPAANQAPMPPESGDPGMRPGMGPRDPQREQMMRAQVEERFGRMVQTELQLNDEQMQRVRQAMRANQDRRIALMRREQDLRRAIGGQMQPGQAANQDSLARMLDAIGHLRVERAQSDEQLMREVSFLTPVQRARLGFMLQRFEQRVNEIRQRSQMGPQPRRGMMR